MAAPKEPHISSQSTPSHASASPGPLFVDIHTPKFGQRRMDAPNNVFFELLRGGVHAPQEPFPSEEVREGG